VTRSRNRNDDASVTVGAGGRGDVVGHGGVDLFVVVVDGGECRLTVVPFPPRSTSRCLVHGVELAPPTSYAICESCGHVYVDGDDLVAAYNECVAWIWSRPDLAFLHAATKRPAGSAGSIDTCQECNAMLRVRT
jgi:hypothetical protein